MNKERRKQLDSAIALIEEARNIIDECTGEERDAFDNLPSGLQEAERGERMSEIIDSLENVSGSLEEAVTALQEAQQ